MSEELDVLKMVTGRLDAAGIPYMVTGSMALNYYAVPRMTRDVDVVAELGIADVNRVAELDSIARSASFNIIQTSLLVKVDFVVRKDTEYRRTEFARRRRVALEGHSFFVVAPEDLIISKLDWARDSRSEVQLMDVRNLIRALPALDWSYLERWTASLGLEALYRELLP